MTIATTPLPEFSTVAQIANRWRVDTHEVMQHYGEAKFLYGATTDYLQPYDRAVILAEVKADSQSILDRFKFVEEEMPKLEAKLVWLSRDEVMRLERGEQATPAPKVKAETVKTPAPVTQGNKLRRNCLDPAIDAAIKQAGSNEVAAVYLQLRKMALEEEAPFTGAINGDALCYTNDKNDAAELTKNALRNRLNRR